MLRWPVVGQSVGTRGGPVPERDTTQRPIGARDGPVPVPDVDPLHATMYLKALLGRFLAYLAAMAVAESLVYVLLGIEAIKAASPARQPPSELLLALWALVAIALWALLL